ncbi:hypothetical protein QBZ16_000605 [Prototheca wickerhamii]|uniref:G domain-containing protein n=1 Tax=Prototheca wickerhamii TaxID=3111 RepID=A0AAD9ILN4_PROWI|nr:hypothetical protein QBZ16_000605 [Prototheca wickerhamii]
MSPSSVHCRYFQIPKKLLEPVAEAAEEEEQPETSAEAEQEGAEDDTVELFNKLIDLWDVRCVWPGCPVTRPQVAVKQYKEQEKDVERLKNEAAEGALPEFDFGKRVGQKIALTQFRKQVLLSVVDVADWEGSFPAETLRGILDAQRQRREQSIYDEDRPRGRAFTANFSWVVAVNKADLLPAQRQHTQTWAGLPRPAAVAVVSGYRGWGVARLLADLQRAVGERGDVYVVGAQNAGKSSLINAMRGAAGLSRAHDVTAAPAPGTTLGLLRVPGLLPAGCHMLDTPGMARPGSLVSLLPMRDIKLLQGRRPFRPRSFRLGAGQSVLLGGLARIDVLSQEQGSTIYLTVWASDAVGCFLGKTEAVDEKRSRHLGARLRPPSDPAAFPALRPRRVRVQGANWRRSTQDVAIAGLGWVGVGLTGAAELAVWVPEGIDVAVRDALSREFAPTMERQGFGSVVLDSSAQSAAPRREKDPAGQEA